MISSHWSWEQHLPIIAASWLNNTDHFLQYSIGHKYSPTSLQLTQGGYHPAMRNIINSCQLFDWKAFDLRNEIRVWSDCQHPKCWHQDLLVLLKRRPGKLFSDWCFCTDCANEFIQKCCITSLKLDVGQPVKKGSKRWNWMILYHIFRRVFDTHCSMGLPAIPWIHRIDAMYSEANVHPKDRWQK